MSSMKAACWLLALSGARALVAPRGLSWRGGALAAGAIAEKEPVLTLYRDTNGWCPFCERVWIALEKKGIAYEEKLIDLQDKPDWYKDIVPTTLVPAIEFHDERYSAAEPGSGRLVWESKDILEALDESFDAVPLRSGGDGVAEVAEVLNASFGFVYGARNSTAAELATKQETFVAALDALDGVLRAKGPFVRGAALSTADLELAPTMERFYYQLAVLRPDFPALDAGRPGLAAWFRAMDGEPAYARRVKGDAYSWTAVTSSFLRFFAANDTETEGKIQKADAAAAAMLQDSLQDAAALADAAAVDEAAARLSMNRAAVARDAADASPKTQPFVARAASTDSADAAIDAALAALADARPRRLRRLRRLARGLRKTAPPQLSDDAKVAASCIAARLCAPRDMGAPAAAALRHVLLKLAQ